MAKTNNPDVFDKLRIAGLRKRVARTLADARGSAGPKDVASRLRSIADEIEGRVRGGGSTASSRTAAAKKAAATRARNAAKRSEAAKKAARTRAKSRS